MKEIDMNGYIEVKLNEYGRYIVEKRLSKVENITIDKDGYIKMQMWKVMKYFGPFLPDMNPFEEMTILVNESNILSDDIKTK